VAFKDHFSRTARQYTQSRPHYPRTLFEFLATLPARRDRAWDCGTGGGQAAVAMAEFFDEVVATDPSAQQIAHAQVHPRVEYLVATAEQSPLEDRSVNLVAAAQALHWFDLERFYDEVRRVAQPAGVVAAWGYEMCRITGQIDPVIGHLYREILGSYWPPERKVTETRYTTIPFPFPEIPAPQFAMTAQWRLDEVIGYLGTWSSVQQYIKRHAANPISAVESDLAAAWGPPETVRQVTWPLFLRAGRIDPAAC
jgi:ubiquinone/menaquinone biosynthesis C-methylase UbiE